MLQLHTQTQTNIIKNLYSPTTPEDMLSQDLSRTSDSIQTVPQVLRGTSIIILFGHTTLPLVSTRLNCCFRRKLRMIYIVKNYSAN
jgi:hypothetical protein